MALGMGHYIIYKDGFKSSADLEGVMNLIGDSDFLELTKEEMMSLQSNLLSLSSTSILSDQRFKRVNDWLRSKSYEVTEINMEPIGRLGGLFRCSTLPLIRQNH
jgi:N-dimethylarginine dimethylaminohydrolase